MAEREGFEPPCRLPDKTLSRPPRYDHFGTSPVGARHGRDANTSLYRTGRGATLPEPMPDDLNPQAKEMADESMVRNLAAQADAIWPQEQPLFLRYALPAEPNIL